MVLRQTVRVLPPERSRVAAKRSPPFLVNKSLNSILIRFNQSGADVSQLGVRITKIKGVQTMVSHSSQMESNSIQHQSVWFHWSE